MGDFTWSTEQRDIPEGADARPDLLMGQACIDQHADGRWVVVVSGPARYPGGVAIISADDARAMALAVLRAQLSGAWTEHLDALEHAR